MFFLLFWLCALGIALILEATHVRILALWYAIGALCGAIAAAVGLPVWAQALLAAAATVGAYFLLRPVAKKFRREAEHHVGERMYIGRHAVVTAEVRQNADTGAVEVDQTTLAASPKVRDAVLPVGARVVISDMRHGRAIVRLSHRQKTGGITKA